MNEDMKTILQEILDDFLQERKEVNKRIQNNLNRLEEIDCFFQSLREETESDFKVFSPRSAENIYKEKIEESNKEKAGIENDNRVHYKRLSDIDRRIEKIQLILKQDEEEPERRIKPKEDTLSLKVLDLQEKERQRIARELHDSSVQNLTHLIHTIELSSMFIDQDPIRAKLELEGCMKTLRTSIDQIRETIFDLRPMSFDDLGFKRCLEEFITNIEKQYSNCIITFDICEIEVSEIDEADIQNAELILMTVYRIIQEAIMNAVKHSQAEKIQVLISKRDCNCVITVTDDGTGFVVEKLSEHKDKHFGIYIMKERVELLNGDIFINTEPGTGTEVKIEIPLF